MFLHVGPLGLGLRASILVFARRVEAVRVSGFEALMLQAFWGLQGFWRLGHFKE